MPHTKRSADFQDLIDKLCAELRTQPAFKDHPITDDLIAVLEYNTTDSGCVVKAADDEPFLGPDWGTALKDAQSQLLQAKERVRHLKAAIAVMERLKRSGASFPGASTNS